MLHGDCRTVHLSLDQRIGAAFASQDLYLHGFFSDSIKPPSDYVAGVVVAFYVCFFTLEFRFCSTFLYLFERRRRRRRKKQKQSLLRHDGLCNGPRITLQWGCRKRLRRIKVRDKGFAVKSGVRRGIASQNVRRIADQESPLHPPLYPLRGSAALVCEGENADERASAASLPRFFVSLSNKEKEEDFMVMKGCKLPQRPKKRSKFIQKCILEKNDVKLEKVLKEAAMEKKQRWNRQTPGLFEGMDFSDEKIYMTAGYLSMMWRRIEFLHVILEMGYNFIFSFTNLKKSRVEINEVRTMQNLGLGSSVAVILNLNFLSLDHLTMWFEYFSFGFAVDNFVAE
ncbi:hypothetical protein ZIOFF_018758 [Zingiber officinale]|uniref:Uncharacterized protein n=1 Tax=Zingiber officinale TaxID=94328 RepID=A0A8J5HGU0_ZINOF|nr:hypothetical protein ZIOFF_018758 [Zingiber officinale]